ncbi:MAG TPA: hypothetical protein VEB42_08675, partial [Chitinophagaceae bacterium]|nr:hypothetical protein [Chitinophagaceae bacterium]
PTTGKDPLYAQLFLTRSVLKIDTVFDNALGKYLEKDLLIKDHSLALQAALNLTASDLDLILKDNGLDIATVKLTLANASMLYRYGLLAKALKLSIPDLISVKALTGLDPFTSLPANGADSNDADVVLNQTLKFAESVAMIKSSGLKIADLDFLFRHKFDATGKYRKVQESALSTIKLLADGINLIRAEHALPAPAANPNDLSAFGAFTDDVLQQKLGLAMDADKVQLFLAMWTGTQPKDWNAVKDSMSVFIQQAQFDLLFVPDAPDADDKTKQQNSLQKRSVLAKALLPFIQGQLISKMIADTLASATGASSDRVNWLTADAARLHISTQPGASLMQIFANAAVASEAANLEAAYTLLSKVQQLAQAFTFTDRELQYIFKNIDLNLLPVKEPAALANAQTLFKSFVRLQAYVSLRNDLAGGNDELITLFESAKITYDNSIDEATRKQQHLQALYTQLAALSRRDVATVQEVAEHLGIAANSQTVNGQVTVEVAAFADERATVSLWNILQQLQSFGVSLPVLKDAVNV